MATPTKPMLTLDADLDGYTMAVTFTASLVGAVTVTSTALPAGTTKRNNLSASASDNIFKAILDAINAAEGAAGTDGEWYVSSWGYEPPKALLKRTPGASADRISTVAISSGLAALMGLAASNTPTHNGGGEYSLQTKALSRVWTCNRYPENDWVKPRYVGAFARTPYGDQTTLIEAAVRDREVVLRGVPGCFVLADTITRADTYLMVSGFTVDDTAAALDSFWAAMLGGGSLAPDMRLRYYPNRADATSYQTVQLARIEELLDPVGAGSWQQTSPTPNYWQIRLSLTDRRE